MALFDDTIFDDTTPLPSTLPVDQPLLADEPTEPTVPAPVEQTWALVMEDGTSAQDYISQLAPASSVPVVRGEGSWADDDIVVTNTLMSLGAWAPTQYMGSVEQLHDWLHAQVIQMGPGDKRDKYEKYRDYLEDEYYNPPGTTNVDLNPYMETIFDANGLAIATVAKYEGVTYLIRDLTAQAQKLLDLQQMIAENDVFDLDQWLLEHEYELQDFMESGAYTGLQALIDKFEDPEQQAQWQEEGFDWAEQIMGLGEGGYETTMQSLLAGMDETDAGLANYENMSPRDTREINRQMARMREDGAMLVESLVGAGRSAEGFMASDRILQTMANEQLAFESKKAEIKLARLQFAQTSQMKRYEYMTSMGQMSATEYINRQYQAAGMQMSMYAQEVAMIEAANRNYLMQHQADMQAFSAHTEALYEQIVLSMGVEEHNMDMMIADYKTMMLPLQQQMAMDAAALAQDQYDAQERQNAWSNIIATLGVGIDLITGIGGLAA